MSTYDISTVIKQLKALTQQQQKKIWLTQIVKHLPVLLWWNGCIILSSGIIHQYWFTIEPLVVAIMTILPSISFIIWLFITKKPARQEAAVQTERILAAKSLFISAWELAHSDKEHKGSALLLLIRSEKKLLQWSEELKRQTLPPIKTKHLFAISLIFFGLFFLLMPTHVVQDKSEAVLITQLNNAHKKQQQKTDQGTALNELFRKAEKHSQTAKQQIKNKTSQPLATHKKEAALNNKTSPVQNIIAKQQTTAQSTNSKSHSKNSTAEKNKKTASSAGNDKSEKSKQLLQSAQAFTQIKRITLQAEISSKSYASDNTSGAKLYNSTNDQSSRQNNSRINTENKLQTGSGLLLNAEQRILVSQYFIELNKSAKKEAQK